MRINDEFSINMKHVESVSLSEGFLSIVTVSGQKIFLVNSETVDVKKIKEEIEMRW